MECLLAPRPPQASAAASSATGERHDWVWLGCICCPGISGVVVPLRRSLPPPPPLVYHACCLCCRYRMRYRRFLLYKPLLLLSVLPSERLLCQQTCEAMPGVLRRSLPLPGLPCLDAWLPACLPACLPCVGAQAALEAQPAGLSTALPQLPASEPLASPCCLLNPPLPQARRTSLARLPALCVCWCLLSARCLSR